MILAIAFLLFDYLPPCQVRVFARCVKEYNRCPFYGIWDSTLWSAYARADATERAYIDARFPLYVSVAKSVVMAQIRNGARA